MLSRLFLVCSLTLSWSSTGYAEKTNNIAPTAVTRNGTYYGIHSTTWKQDFFFGVPYVQPPVGQLRYRAPTALNTSWTGTRNATQIGYECIGYADNTINLGNIISEDCLTMNIIRPSGYDGVQLPVAVWIHGGFFAGGGNLDPRWNLTFIVQASVDAGKPMIGIGINYRLHGWGFLWSKEIQEEGIGNLGLRDQNAAFRWIHENIAGFNGDPSKVTIWGESAGATSVGSHLIAFGGRDDKLFRSAITQSGAPISSTQYSPLSVEQVTYDKLVQTVGCSNASASLSCLREVPRQTLSNAFNSSFRIGGLHLPVIDGDFIREPASISLSAGRFIKIPLLNGANSDEGTSFFTRGVNELTPFAINTTDQFRIYLSSISKNNDTISTLEALYPDIPGIEIPAPFQGRPQATKQIGSQAKRHATITGDYFFHAPRRYTSENWAKWNLTTYSYRFNVVPNGVAPLIGATHYQEVAFVFANTGGVGYSIDPFGNDKLGVARKEVARLMSRMWISFVVTGDPNGSGVPSVAWPKYSLDNPKNFVFDSNVTSYVENDYYRAEGIEYFSRNLNLFNGR